MLVAHSEADVRRQIVSVLDGMGVSAIESDTANGAARLARSAAPEIALIQSDLCSRDGVRLLSDFKEDPDLFQIEVILLHRELGLDEAKEALTRGAHDHLREPIDPLELVTRVDSAQRARRMRVELLAGRGRLEGLAFADELTGLHNRRALSHRLSGLIGSARRHRRSLAVVVLDIDHFKTINDTLGHGAGDEAMVAVGERLVGAAREEDVVGRWGGDEFVVLLPDETDEGAAAAAERLRAAVAAGPFTLAGRTVPVTISVGWASWTGEDPDDLVREADVALYRAKRAGRNIVRGNRSLADVSPQLLARRLAAEAERIAGAPSGLYVVELEGRELVKVAGDPELPQRLPIGQRFGPEIAEVEARDVQATVNGVLPDAAVQPLWFGGRAVAALVMSRTPLEPLDGLAREAAPALELANQATDVFHIARRKRDVTAAAELQQDLLPPSIGRLTGAELAASILPAYEVGGDWFDWSQNADDARLSIGDALGSGEPAMALGAVAVSALRASRRNRGDLTVEATGAHAAIQRLGSGASFATAILARWDAASFTFSWLTFGHPQPLLVDDDDAIRPLEGEVLPPLGVPETLSLPPPGECRLRAGQRLVLYTDGISERRVAGEGLFDVEGIAAAIRATSEPSAAATVRSIQSAVRDASDEPVTDDATVMVLAPR